MKGTVEGFIGLYDQLLTYLGRAVASRRPKSSHELLREAGESNKVIKEKLEFLENMLKLGDAIKGHPEYPHVIIAHPTSEALSRFKSVVENVISPKTLIPAFKREIRRFFPSDQLVVALRYMNENDYSQGSWISFQRME